VTGFQFKLTDVWILHFATKTVRRPLLTEMLSFKAELVECEGFPDKLWRIIIISSFPGLSVVKRTALRSRDLKGKHFRTFKMICCR
jgi:hypothetical protein